MFKKQTKSLSVPENLPALLPVNELFIISWATYRAKIKVLIYAALFGLLPSLFVAILLAVITAIFSSQPNFIVIKNSLVILMAMPLLYVSLRINIAIYLIVSKNIASVKKAWATAGKYFWNYSLTLFWTGLLIMLLMFFFIVPGFIFFVFYSMVLWVFFMENYYGYTAIKRSRELVTGYWGSVSLRWLALLVPLFILAILDSIISNTAINNFISSVVDFFFGLFAIIYTYYLYKDLRKIKGTSTLEQQAYAPWVYVAITLALLVLFIALYLLVVFGPAGARLAT